MLSRQVGEVARRLRQEGKTLPLTDIAIATVAACAKHALWSFDGDFKRIRGALDTLELYEPR